jgi:predicted nucleic acid-binding protein
MSGSAFGTNVVLYIAGSDSAKAGRAERLTRQGGIISVQVLNESASVLRRKRNMPWARLQVFLDELQTMLEVQPLTLEIHQSGLRLAERYGFSIYDSFIVAAALAAECDTLWSEDMQDDLLVDQKLQIVNPFRP